MCDVIDRQMSKSTNVFKGANALKRLSLVIAITDITDILHLQKVY